MTALSLHRDVLETKRTGAVDSKNTRNADQTCQTRTSRMARMALWVRREKRLWIIILIFVALFLLGTLFELANANNADVSVERAVRNVLNRRKAVDLSSDHASMLNEQHVDSDSLDGRGGGLSMDDTAADEDEEEEAAQKANIRAALVCAFGTVFSLHTLLIEHMKWDPKSFQKFSIATKIPVEIFCVSGPLVLVSAIIYTIMAGLLFLGGGSSSAFFIAASWSAIMIDMSFVCYTNALYEIFTNRVDLVLHIVNFFTVYNAFNQLRFFPFTFVICGLFFWTVVIGIRLVRRFRSGPVVNANVFRPGSP